MKVRFFVHESPRIGPKETKIEADLRFSVRWLVHPSRSAKIFSFLLIPVRRDLLWIPTSLLDKRELGI